MYVFGGFIFSDFQYSSVVSSSSLMLFSGPSNPHLLPSVASYISVIVFCEHHLCLVLYVFELFVKSFSLLILLIQCSPKFVENLELFIGCVAYFHFT